jgi:chemotaxis protein CheX
MDICIVGSKWTDQMERLQRCAHDNGCHVHKAVPFAGSLSRLGQAGGVVVFDDGAPGVIDWVGRVRANTRYLSIPIVAVAARTGKDAHARLLAAGVSSVLDRDAAHDRIFSEIQRQCAGQVVMEEVRQQLLEPFTTATSVTLREMAGTEVTTQSVYQTASYKMFGDISAVLGFLSPREGTLVLSFPEAAAEDLVGRILAGVTDDPDADLVRDGVGEVANVIAGQAKALLAGTPYQFTFSTPTIVSGAGHEIRHQPGMPCLVIAFGSDVGDFALQICLKV